jgi:hypothetical protein
LRTPAQKFTKDYSVGMETNFKNLLCLTKLNATPNLASSNFQKDKRKIRIIETGKKMEMETKQT